MLCSWKHLMLNKSLLAASTDPDSMQGDLESM
jgi:hypothetical protein